ncbi:MAG: hypothetical protein AABN95_14715 [Acidobacteriota bacterium]
MKIKLLFAIFGMLIGAQSSIAKEWRGIVPLKSTRTDVERRFGKPDKWGDYHVDQDRVSFRYSEGGPCTDLYRALGKDNCYCSLEDGTVISISVEPTVKRKFSDLKLDMTKFKKVPISPFPYNFAYYNPTEGIDYEVDESEDRIRSIEYDAAAVDCENIIKSRAPKYRNSWRGLIPLHVNRWDVERLLGTPQRTWESSAAYDTDHEIVSVKYAKGKCGEPNTEWNVPDDTVIELVVGQRLGFLLSQLNLDLSRYNRQEDFPYPEIENPPKVANYIDSLNGIIVRTQSSRGGGGEEVVVSITYRPANKDAKLRCVNSKGPSKKP